MAAIICSYATKRTFFYCQHIVGSTPDGERETVAMALGASGFTIHMSRVPDELVGHVHNHRCSMDRMSMVKWLLAHPVYMKVSDQRQVIGCDQRLGATPEPRPLKL
jgi:hypothetical protein